MAAITGYGGSATFASGTVAIIRKWDLDHQANLEDTTGMASGASGAKSWTSCLTEWSCTFEGDVDSADTGFKSSGHIRGGQSGAITLVAGGKTYSGNVIIKGAKITNDVAGVLTYSITAQGNGDLTFPSA